MSEYKGIKGFQVQTRTEDPTDGVAGDFYYNSSTGQFKTVNEGGAPIGSWSSGGSMNTARDYVAGAAANKDSALIAGGPSNVVEQYDGSSWTEVAEMSSPAPVSYSRSSVGIATAAIVAGGSSSYVTNTEQWNGSSWTEIAEINEGRGFGQASPIGTVTAGLVVGGFEAPPGQATAKNEEWNGSSWTEKGDLNTARGYNAGLGVYTSAMVCNGQSPPPGFTVSNTAETWDGTSWTEVAEINTARARGVASGVNSDNALFFAGATGPSTSKTNTEFWNGSSWTEVADLASGRMRGGGGGTISSAIMAAGAVPPNTASTEEWSAADFQIKTVTTG